MCVTLCGKRRKEIRNLHRQPCICDTRAIPAKTVALRPDRAKEIKIKLKKFVGWILRFKNGARDAVTRRKEGTSSLPRTNQKIKPLDVEELQSAERAIIKAVQTGRFGEERLSHINISRKLSY